MDQDDSSTFERATPVLKVADYRRARAFYCDKLGFTVAEEGGDPPRFGIVKRGKAVLFLDAWHGGARPVEGAWDAYLHVGKVDALHDALAAAGVAITRPVQDTVYGMREFEVTDPDGNVICFGEDV